MEGLYAVYYTGSAGSGAFGLLLSKGNVWGVDPTGGDVSGTYALRPDGGLDLVLTFTFAAGAVLVTGQTLAAPMVVPANVRIMAATLAGGQQAVQLPMGSVMVRVRKKASI